MVERQRQRDLLAKEEPSRQAVYSAMIEKYNEEFAAYWQKVEHVRTLLRGTPDHNPTIAEVERAHFAWYDRPLRPPPPPLPEPLPPTHIRK